MAPNPCVAEVTPVCSLQTVASGCSIPSPADFPCPGCLCGFPCAPGFVTHCGSSQWHKLMLDGTAWVMSVCGNTLLRMRFPRELTPGAKSPLGPGNWACCMSGGATPEWCLSTEVWELWVSFPATWEAEKGKAERKPAGTVAFPSPVPGQIQHPSHCASSFPTALHIALGSSFQAQPVFWTCRRVRPPRAWMWARAAPQLLVDAGVGAAAASAFSHIPMDTDVMKVIAGSTTLSTHFEIVCVPHFWKPKSVCGCTGGKKCNRLSLQF